jgi:DNA-binding response OmpR family regulator
MIVTTPQQRTPSNLRSLAPAAAKPRLLLVCDSAERLSALRARLKADEFEVTSVASPEELRRACRVRHQLAVVDVSPGRIVEVLRTVRASAEQADVSVLVESSRLASKPKLAGVLAEYRAMPCSEREMVALARRRLTPAPSARPGRRVL